MIERPQGAVTYIDLPTPKMGGKTWLLNKPGIFVLEPGPGVIQSIAVTHPGSGTLAIRDGVPDDRGNYIPIKGLNDDQQNGRPIWVANPIYMQMWMLNAGLFHGLTVECTGGHHQVAPRVTIVWMPFKERVKNG